MVCSTPSPRPHHPNVCIAGPNRTLNLPPLSQVEASVAFACIIFNTQLVYARRPNTLFVLQATTRYLCNKSLTEDKYEKVWASLLAGKKEAADVLGAVQQRACGYAPGDELKDALDQQMAELSDHRR